MENFINVRAHGVAGDGITNNTERINELISNMKEGGILFFPPGVYVSGPIILKSNMTFYLSTGAVLMGSDNKDEFWYVGEDKVPGYTRGDRIGLITAFEEENIIIEGGGTIDARGYFWWETDAEDSHRPRTIQPILCTNVKIRDISIQNSPMWTIHPLCCKDVVIQNVRIKNPSDSPNTDGINPESCSNVHISDCTIDVGDDCITLKSGLEEDVLQRDYPCENITIVNCTLLNGHGGVVIGSEMSGGVKRVAVTNCIFYGTDRGIRIKTRRGRGGAVKEIMVSNLLMEEVLVPFSINGFYFYDREIEGYYAAADSTTPVIENIWLSNLRAYRCKVAAVYIKGLPEMPVRGIVMNNVWIDMEVDEAVEDIPIMMPGIEKMQGRGIFLDNIIDSSFENISVSVASGEVLHIDKIERVTYNGEEL